VWEQGYFRGGGRIKTGKPLLLLPFFDVVDGLGGEKDRKRLRQTSEGF
jgi:hypothetical protein